MISSVNYHLRNVILILTLPLCYLTYIPHMLSVYIVLPVLNFLIQRTENYTTVQDVLGHVRYFFTDEENPEKRLNEFYQFRAHTYDITRPKYLLARHQLTRSCVAEVIAEYQQGIVWVDVGSGTGYLVTLLSDEERNAFKAIYLVDICEPLMKVAEQRIRENGWTNVHLVKGNASSMNTLKELDGQVHLCTFSYSLSMMEDWMYALVKAKKWLVPGGFIGIADFYISKKYILPNSMAREEHSFLKRTLLPPLIALNNVFLNSDLIPFLDISFPSKPSVLHEKEMGLPYFLPLFSCPYFMFIGRKEH